jgi:hypothetical protein
MNFLCMNGTEIERGQPFDTGGGQSSKHSSNGTPRPAPGFCGIFAAPQQKTLANRAKHPILGTMLQRSITGLTRF